ncbi:MAG: hypothetical protein ACOYUZ_00955 [Patescibacteria group bacterium]
MTDEQAQQITWESIRINSAAMGWHHIILQETTLHLYSLLDDQPTCFGNLHLFYDKIATARERRKMLIAGYCPPN